MPGVVATAMTAGAAHLAPNTAVQTAEAAGTGVAATGAQAGAVVQKEAAGAVDVLGLGVVHALHTQMGRGGGTEEAEAARRSLECLHPTPPSPRPPQAFPPPRVKPASRTGKARQGGR